MAGSTDPGITRRGARWEPRYRELPLRCQTRKNLAGSGLGNPYAHTLPPWGDGQAAASVSSFSVPRKP